MLNALSHVNTVGRGLGSMTPFMPAAPASRPSTQSTGGRVSKEVEVKKNDTARCNMNGVAYKSGWSTSYCEGMLLFSNIARDITYDAVLTGTIPVVNYYLEQAARSDESDRKRKFEQLDSDVVDQKHLLASSVSEFIRKWRLMGAIHTKMGEHYALDVAKTSRIFNIWGNVRVGDKLYLKLCNITNTYDRIWNPNGDAEDWCGKRSPPSFLQVVPISCGEMDTPVRQSEGMLKAMHDTDTEITDFWSNTVVQQCQATALEWDSDGNCTAIGPDAPLVVEDDYQFGHCIYVGTVMSVPPGANRSRSALDIQQALRSNRKMQSLPLITVCLFS